MRSQKLSIRLTAALGILTTTLVMAGTRAVAQAEGVLHNFNNNGKDGYSPYAGLIFDGAGNLYGTTEPGGAYGKGTVFELLPSAGGGWTEKRLHSFGANSTDGNYPQASLIFDGAGNLYGTTYAGGAYGYGTVFELLPAAGGGWMEKVLRNFKNNGGGANPYAGLIFDPAGNLYGTTVYGGSGSCTQGCGTVFELTPQAGGGWTEKILHAFSNDGTDGFNPYASLIFDAAGNLYGTTQGGGAHAHGTVFELTPRTGGGWTGTILHDFNNNGTDGYNPANLIFDTAGNLFGTTYLGGANSGGAAFELTPTTGGSWTETLLYSFKNYGSGTAGPSGLTLDTAGNLYGTTPMGGAEPDRGGTAFELMPTTGGWTYRLLHSFGLGTDGDSPQSVLIFDAAGNLYGTTQLGGANNVGTVFEIKP
jgi:uncharacterized repeat protein (TIGR03803 family)